MGRNSGNIYLIFYYLNKTTIWFDDSFYVLSFQSKFRFDDPVIRKEYVMGALGSRCKDVKRRLWKEYKRNTMSETLQNGPKNVPEIQWGHFVEMRFTEKWKVQFIR